jgi:hypothetical protein
VLYFTGHLRDHEGIHCIGTAVSPMVSGPFTPTKFPFECEENRGGAIDASGFLDPATGRRFVTYKVDGNNLGHGGPCKNEYTKFPTPLLLQEVAEDGITKIGSSTQILDRDDADGPLVEAPSLAYTGNKYLLFFSSNCFSTPLYDISFAVADSVFGPYTKSPRPLLVTGDLGLHAPGGAEVTADGEFITFHAGTMPQRHMFTAKLTYQGGFSVSVCGNGGCQST